MAALLVLLLLLAIPLTTFTADVYYVTADDAAGDEQSCPPHQICHNLSYYISQPGHYFTNNTIIIFLEGQHSFDKEDLVQVNNVHNLTLKGQGEWPVAGAEETVMQSTVMINCTRGRGGFIFDTGYDITIEGLTITNCGNVGSENDTAVVNFLSVSKAFFCKNSIQRMSGYGLMAKNCDKTIISNCSYYHSIFCSGGGIAVHYNQSLLTSDYNSYTLKLTYSNMTKCCSSGNGGGIELETYIDASVDLVFSHLILSQNEASTGGGLAASLRGEGKVSLRILNCIFFEGLGVYASGGASIVSKASTSIIVKGTDFMDNGIINRPLKGNDIRRFVSELSVSCNKIHSSTFLLLDSSISHTKANSGLVASITRCSTLNITRTRMVIANQKFAGVMVNGVKSLNIKHSQFENSYNLPSVLLIMRISSNLEGISKIINCTFFKNYNGKSVVTIYNTNGIFVNSSISDNNMTGITAIESDIQFHGHNVIQNNRYTEGAGITLVLPGVITVSGELYLLNNTAEHRGGAILVMPLQKLSSLHTHNAGFCTFSFENPDNVSKNSSFGLINFVGNKAGSGGADIYGATMIDCKTQGNVYVMPIGNHNETSWYFNTPLVKHFHFITAEKLSSMSSDPIMVCFCNSNNLPDCSDRTHHIQAYPGQGINTTIATVGYYGGTSPGVVQVSAQHAKLVHFFGQNESTNCFQLHILLQNMSSTTALINITVDGGLQDWGLSLTVDFLDCPIGFTTGNQISRHYQCNCVPLLADNHVKCNVSLDPYKFLKSGNSWFAYINNTHTCITGTTSCPFDYCNRSNISFDIMAPDRQCVANRTGILCGQCQSNLSIMLGSNRCGTCSNWYLFLLPVFALAGIVLVAVLMFLNLSVSVGTINGLLFYANMLKLNEVFFFPNGSIPVVSQFISWLNLDLGIEVCLYDGLDGYWNTWLQFVFPAYLFLLISGIIVGCRYSVWLCRLCGSHAVPALATLFFMSYTKILFTVTNALSMTRLPCNDSILTVWSVDGSIEYGSGKHLILVVVSCGVLIIGLAYPALVLCAPLLERYSHKCIPQCRWNPVTKFKPLLDAYGGPYKDKYRFWTGVTLMVRLTLTVTFSFTSGGYTVVNAYIIITVIVGIFTLWSFTKGVYKNAYLNALEAVYLFNLFFLSTVSLAAFSFKTSCEIATIFSVSLSFIVSQVTIVIHIKQNCEFKKIKRKLGFKDQPRYIAVPQVAADEDYDENALLGSPPSIVYGTQRGVRQFVLEIPGSSRSIWGEQESSSPLLLEREPLLFDTNTIS